MFDPHEILKQLSLEEKASLCSGQDFWHLRGFPRLNIPSMMFTDGPHGLRKQVESPDHVGLSDSEPATCFPPAVTLASTWNVDLAKAMGIALGLECKDQGVSVILGPGANIKRHPYCGRNFEYFSEDPLLSGSMASAWIQGVQSQGIGTSLKHFALNNQESHRMVVDVIVDERSMHDIYLKGFKKAICEAQPWTIMSAYNKVNGYYMSEHPSLLNPLLRDTWGYEGAVITDWGANHDRIAGIKAGQDVEMPGGLKSQIDVILDGVKQGKITLEELDARVLTILELIKKASLTMSQSHTPSSLDDHHNLARIIASEGIVLLKNESNLLPLKKSMNIAMIGELSKLPRYQGSGSSLIHPHKVVSLYDALSSSQVHFTYAPGYSLHHDDVDPHLIQDAINHAQRADVVICMVGLPDRYESEGFDRKHPNLPISHIKLIEALCAHHPKVVVCCSHGSSIVMPWHHQPQAILEAYLGGQASGEALMDVLFGDVNPSGKLAESFVHRMEDHLSHHYFPGHEKQVQYREGIYVGYRWLSTAGIKPAYPFGYGLSYSSFKTFNENVHLHHDEIVVQGIIHNQSPLDGAQTIQVYAQYVASKVVRPKIVLIGFKKLKIAAHESQTFTIAIPISELAFTQDGQRKCEAGEVLIHVGTSSEDFFYSSRIMIQSNDEIIDERHSPYFQPQADFRPTQEDFESLLKHPIPTMTPLKPFTLNSTLKDVSIHPLGKVLLWIVIKLSKSGKKSVADEFNQSMIEHMIIEMPLRALINFSKGKLSTKTIQRLLNIMNVGIIKTFKDKGTSNETSFK
jgi:beta-glucosidase